MSYRTRKFLLLPADLHREAARWANAHGVSLYRLQRDALAHYLDCSHAIGGEAAEYSMASHNRSTVDLPPELAERVAARCTSDGTKFSNLTRNAVAHLLYCPEGEGAHVGA